jgi:predicted TIM-barrel fold metal-dependent hydrolase
MGAARIFDIHCHIGPWLRAEELLGLMDAAGVEQAAVFPCPSVWSLPNPDNYYNTNDYVAEAQGRYPDRLIGFACLNPQYTGDTSTGMPNLAVREARRALVELGLCGVKLHPEVHCFTVGSLVGSELMETLAVIQSERGRPLPVLCHGMTTMGAMPEQFAALAGRYPSLPIIIAHGGGFQNLYFTSIAPVAQHAKLYVDLAMTTIDDLHLVNVARTIGIDKVLFGTDHFARPQTNLYRNFLFVLEGAFPDPEARAKVLGGNARRVLGLG